jgi:hypothetical protein
MALLRVMHSPGHDIGLCRLKYLQAESLSV